MSARGLPRREQIAHIREHQEKFDAHQQETNADVQRYFDMYRDSEPHLYYNLCLDLGIEPRGNWDHLFDGSEDG